VDLCEQNIVDNSLDGRITVITKDLRRLRATLDPGSMSAIVANPPYIKEGTGRTSPHAARQIARHDWSASLEAWLDLHRYLKNGGRYCLVFPAARLAELVALMKRRKLEPKRLRLVHPYHDKPASLVLVEAIKSGGPGLEVLPSLVIHSSRGGYTEELKQIYGFTLNS